MSCITLLSDLGLQDASVASAKGILMQYIPTAKIVDVSHQVSPFHLQEAAYLLTASYMHFPQGSCHIVLCDIFYEKGPVMTLYEKNGQYILAPDNGILSLAFGDIESVYKVAELTESGTFINWLHGAATFAQKLQTEKPAQITPLTITPKHAAANWKPMVTGSTVECHVIHIDRFENVVLNITKEEFEAIGNGRPFRIEFTRNETVSEISNNYYDVKEGEKLCRFNAAGYLEIAMNRGNAASLFGLSLRKEKHLIYNAIKIYFS